jgi:hypothetical protein
MKALRLVITFCALTFITTGVLAQSEEMKLKENQMDSISEESSKVSAAYAISLFNFISLVEEEKDSTEVVDGSNSFNFLELIQNFIYTIPRSLFIFS